MEHEPNQSILWPSKTKFLFEIVKWINGWIDIYDCTVRIDLCILLSVPRGVSEQRKKQNWDQGVNEKLHSNVKKFEWGAGRRTFS
ncbi:hypothetical protein LOC71_20860 [Rhodopirellula sp. JC740]|uniref:Uncharacterized protein n=1 Tax=Rhodopirellula halodulae TaxID=2894198 RepID=A0ABS8NMG8_9BACT|nr:hypothetical protein [Rhodopirellula sp. JC740]MCC9644732.1 hypothetical protein [Rhodopirellula sp. JC740]